MEGGLNREDEDVRGDQRALRDRHVHLFVTTDYEPYTCVSNRLRALGATYTCLSLSVIFLC